MCSCIHTHVVEAQLRHLDAATRIKVLDQWTREECMVERGEKALYQDTDENRNTMIDWEESDREMETQ